MYADYFLFNFLSEPSSVGLFGGGGLITDIHAKLTPGKGYFIGMGLYDNENMYVAHLDPALKGKADPAKRVKDKFRFSRADDATPYDVMYGRNTIAALEEPNMDSYTMTLDKGFNYLGNPYTAPLDLGYLIDGPQNIESGYWVPTSGTGKYENGKYIFSTNYLKAQKIGATTTTTDFIVAPMQMFVVKATTATASYVISRKRCSLSRAGNTMLTRATSTDLEPVDELLIETADLKTGGFDRASVVFRAKASLLGNDLYDSPKLFNRSGGVNQLYTRSSDGQNLTVSVISPETQQLPLYFEPAAETQQVRLRVSRLKSLHSVGSVILADNKTGTMTDLSIHKEYVFTSAPGDAVNRFVLFFTGAVTAVTPEQSAAMLHVVSSVEGLHITGLHHSTMLYVYDMTGKKVFQRKVNENAMLLPLHGREHGHVMIVVNDGRCVKSL
jgi:hypothetical protein